MADDGTPGRIMPSRHDGQIRVISRGISFPSMESLAKEETAIHLAYCVRRAWTAGYIIKMT